MGEFYETYGVDAVMMMQHAGLNKMGQEVRAGCPRKNVQQTLDGLTGAGLTVAVYEEARESHEFFLMLSGLVFVLIRFGLVGRLVWFGFGVALLWFWFDSVCCGLVWFGLGWFGLIWFGLAPGASDSGCFLFLG